MPTYHYLCNSCEKKLEVFSTIAVMEAAEAAGMRCECGDPLRRDYKPKRHVVFCEGVYENIGDEPIQINSAQQLVDECQKRGNSSVYMRDMGGLFGAKENKWV